MKAYETASPTRVDQPQTGSIADSGRRLVSGRLGATLVLSNAFWGWAGPVLIMIFGGFLRFYRLSKPDAVVFDETYYVPDANSILRHGVELQHYNYVNSQLVRGDPDIFLSKHGALQPELVAHPALGKIMMAFGQWLFGLTPFGWRFTVALVGTVSILMVARIVRRMTRSTMLGCVAGLLVALDGLELVLSRTAILDIFVMFWVLAAFGLLVIDRDQTIARLQAVAAGGSRGLPRRGVGEQVDRPVLPDRFRRPGHRLGHGRPASRRLSGLAGRRPAQRRQMAARLVPGDTRRDLHRVLERLVRHQRRLRPQLGRHRRQPHAGLVHHRLLVPVQPLDAPVRARPALIPELQIQPPRLARADPADLVLLCDPQGLRRLQLLL